MFDCSKEFRQFHDEAVKLPKEKVKQLEDQRKANESRLTDGLKSAKEPSPVKFIEQGSYAMGTMVQHSDNDYDIDDGVVFFRKDLKGTQGADKTSLEARNMVCDALQHDSFKKPPEVRTNCVRIYYNEGHHVDMPVYRQESLDAKSTRYELASVDWKESNPEGVTKWFNQRLAEKKSSQDDDDHQLRRIVRMLKAFGRSRPSWNMPSGLIMTVLANETFQIYDAREDRAFHNALLSIHLRLSGSLEVPHPVLSENITKTKSDANMKEFLDKASWALDVLKPLSDPKCARKEALKAWATVFGTDFFDRFLKERITVGITTSKPSRPVEKDGGQRFG